MSGNSEYILELNKISKSFPGVKALDRVSLKIRKCTVHGICGENGAGKSTLIKIVNGIYSMDNGEIIYKGNKVHPDSPRQMLDMGIATIHQELSPIMEMSVAENIFLAREPRTKTKLLDWKKMYSETQRLMDQFGFHYQPKQKIKELKVSDIQLLEIVKAVSRDASIIIMDEPTSSITETETKLLFDIIKNLKQRQISVIYISHKMDEIKEICDEVTVFRDGQWVATHDVENIEKNKLIELMVGREIKDIYPKTEAKIGKVVFEVRGLNSEGKFKDIDFSIRSGEIVGFAGLVGAGRTEVFRAIFGLDSYTSGKIYMHGEEIKIKNVQEAIAYGILMVSEDRKKEGVIQCRSIKENISIASVYDMRTHGLLDNKKERKQVDDMINVLSVKCTSSHDLVSSLSGGNQQKVVLAKWLLKEPKLLIFDEPTRGIDVGAKYEIYKLMGDLVKNGVPIVMISSELPEIIGMSDRVVVMSQGKITGELKRSELSQERIMELSVKEIKKS